jgi:hypothetical protein
LSGLSRTAAYHEAGHAIARLATGGDLASVAIDPAGNGSIETGRKTSIVARLGLDRRRGRFKPRRRAEGDPGLGPCGPTRSGAVAAPKTGHTARRAPERRACEIRLRAERKAGELLAVMEEG